MQRRIGPALAILGLLAIAGPLLPVPARADTTGSFAGNVAYINKTRIGVKSGQNTRDFIIPDGFTNVVKRSSGATIPISTITVGEFVTVKFLQSALFGSTKATKIIVGSQFNLNVPFNSSPLPAASPTR